MTSENIKEPVMVMWSPWQFYPPSYKYQHWLHSFALPFWFFFFSFSCLVMICLALWSQPGSSPRISPQRHNYHTGLNVPPTSSGTHQRPFTLQTSKPPLLRFFHSVPSPLTVCFIHVLNLFWSSCSSFPPPRLSWKWGEMNAFNLPDGMK